MFHVFEIVKNVPSQALNLHNMPDASLQHFITKLICQTGRNTWSTQPICDVRSVANGAGGIWATGGPFLPNRKCNEQPARLMYDVANERNDPLLTRPLGRPSLPFRMRLNCTPLRRPREGGPPLRCVHPSLSSAACNFPAGCG